MGSSEQQSRWEITPWPGVAKRPPQWGWRSVRSQARGSLRGGEHASRDHPAAIDFYFVMVKGAAFVFECRFIRCTLINKKSSS